MFSKPKNRGNTSEDADKYKSYRWKKYSAQFTRGKRCEHPGCPMLATVTDHRIRHRAGGAFWDRRNWQSLCFTCHKRKTIKESHGHIEPFIETEYGRIPADKAHLPPDIAGQSYLIK